MPSKVRKIAVVTPKYGLIGGAEGFAAELTERIAQNNRYEIHVFANQWRNHSSRIIFHKIPIISFPKFLTTFSFAYFAQRQISKMNFYLIHTHERIFSADLFTMHGIPHRIWVRKVREENKSLFDYATAWVEEKLVRSQRCQRFLTVSSLVREIFLQEYHDIHPNKVQVIHPGVDMQRFQRLNRQLCRQEIRNHLGIKDQVIFLGVVEKTTLDKIYLASDIYAMPSIFDTFGIAVLEAMAASLPVVISGNVGAKDIVGEGTNGFVLENTNSPDEICDKIGFLLKEESRSKMGDQALKAASRYTWEAAAKKVENIYEDLLGDRP